MRNCLVVPLLSAVMLFSSAVQAVTPLQAALLVQQVGALDPDETYLAGFLAQHEITYDVADARMLKEGTMDLSKYNVLYLRTGAVPILMLVVTFSPCPLAGWGMI